MYSRGYACHLAVLVVILLYPGTVLGTLRKTATGSNHNGVGASRRGLFDDIFQQMHTLQEGVEKLGIGKLEVTKITFFFEGVSRFSSRYPLGAFL